MVSNGKSIFTQGSGRKAKVNGRREERKKKQFEWKKKL